MAEIKINYVFTFGKHKGKSIREVIEKDPSYVPWCVQNIKWFKLHKDVVEINAKSYARFILNRGRRVNDSAYTEMTMMDEDIFGMGQGDY